MSQSKARYEAERWWQTASEDLEAAQVLLEAGKYAQCCFLCQQSAKKAVKALWYRIDEDPWGHSIQKLIMEYPNKDYLHDFEVLANKGAYLDKLYIPTRYPNGLPDLTPGKAYFKDEASNSIEIAAFFLSRTREFLDSLDKVT